MNTFDVVASQLLHDFRRKHSGGEGSSEDRVELLIQTTDAHLGEVPVRIDDRLPDDLALRLSAELDGGGIGLLEDDAGVGQADADLKNRKRNIWI